MDNINSKIKNFNFNRFSLKELCDFFNVKGLPIMGKKVPIGTQIFRCRPHGNNNDFFYFERDISYRTDLQNIKSFGRGNFPNSSKFYCSISTEEVKEGYVTSIYETSLNLRNNHNGIEFYTVGMWTTQKELEVVAVKPDSLNEHLSKSNEDLVKIFNDYKSKQSFNEYELEFHELIGKEFTKKVKNGNDNLYAISSAFSESILQNTKVDGIIYPAVQTESKGNNIVLNPIKADEFLHLEEVIYGVLYKFGDFSTFNPLKKAELKEGYPFKWKNDDRTKNNGQVIEFLKKYNITETKIIETLFEQIKRMRNI